MKLIKQSILHFENVKSDKVYEVDLCETADGLFLVNFRYGRRGKQLREGTKTSTPVDRQKADTIFDKLVKEKEKKGYYEVGESDEIVSAESATIDASLVDIQSETIEPFELNIAPVQESTIIGDVSELIGQMLSGDTGELKTSNGRTLERLLWRCGELRLKRVVEPIAHIPIPEEDGILSYTIAWTLGRCADKNMLGYLENMRRNIEPKSKTGKAIRMARMELLADDEKEILATHIESILLDSQVKSSLPSLVSRLLEDSEKGQEAREDILNLYLVSDYYPMFRQAILRFVDETPIAAKGFFKAFRTLLKAAEFRGDGELLGKIAYRIQKTAENFDNPYGWGNTYIENEGWVKISEELKKPNSRIAYSAKTRDYMLRRIARLLRRRGKDQDPSYVRLAVGILLAYSDEDRIEPETLSFYTYDEDWNSHLVEICYTEYSPYVVFNQILFGNSSRVTPNKGGYKWMFTEGNKNKFSALKREEAFPELWDKMPQGLLHLLAESKSQAVHEFAVKAIKSNTGKIIELIDADFVVRLLSAPYEGTQDYGVYLARAIYKRENPDFHLVKALLESNHPKARTIGMTWMKEQETLFIQKEDFLFALYFNPHEDVRAWLTPLDVNAHFDEVQQANIVAKVIGRMLNLTNVSLSVEERNGILGAGELTITHYKETLKDLDLRIVNQLLFHDIEEVSVFGAKILVNHNVPAEDLSEELLLGLISAQHPELKQLGVQLLGKLKDHNLKDKLELLTTLSVSPHKEIRQEVYPIIQRLADTDPDFGKNITLKLVPHILTKEDSEGRDEDLINLFLDNLKKHLVHVPVAMVLNLLYSTRKPAHELGYFLLNDHVDGKDLTIRQIVRLGSNELVAVRNWVWTYYKEQTERIKAELAEAVRLLDAKWEDSRDFAINFLKEDLSQEDWNPDVLVSICDSVNPVVQQFGQDRITKFFDKKDGEQYLLQLSQHPSQNIQHFATNYLENFAADRPENIKELEHYFTTVLSGVNKSSVAKKRIFDFIQKEGLKDKATASILVEIIARQSATMAIRDKARCIEIMRDFKTQFPTLKMPIAQKDYMIYPVNSQKI